MKWRKQHVKQRCYQDVLEPATFQDTGLETPLGLAHSHVAALTPLLVPSPTSCVTVKICPQPGCESTPSGPLTWEISLSFFLSSRSTLKTAARVSIQFLLDCTVLPDVIILHQQHGRVVHDSLLYLTRTYCFSVYKARSKLLGKWNLKTWNCCE